MHADQGPRRRQSWREKALRRSACDGSFHVAFVDFCTNRVRRLPPLGGLARQQGGARSFTVSRMKTFNLNSDEWDGTRDREGWRAKGALVGQHVGGELIGATMSEVEPGSRLWPYHTHYLNEEWVIVLRGEPTLRTPEGEHVLKEGDVVCFPRGKDGAHQIINRTDSAVRVLMLSSMIRGEIIEYLDTGKLLAKDVEDEDIMFARPGPTVEYWEGED
jgi:uncharacterized cupin superfamily protein